MKDRMQVVSPDGGAEIEIFKAEFEYYSSIGFTEKKDKPAKAKGEKVYGKS